MPIDKAARVADAYSQDAINQAAAAQQLAGVAGDRALSQAYDSWKISREAADQAIAQSDKAAADFAQAKSALDAAQQARDQFHPVYHDPPPSLDDQAKAQVKTLDDAYKKAASDYEKKRGDCEAKNKQAKKANDAANKAANAVKKAVAARQKGKQQEQPPGAASNAILKTSLEWRPFDDPPSDGFVLVSPGIPLTPVSPKKPKGGGDDCCCCCLMECLQQCCGKKSDYAGGDKAAGSPAGGSSPKPDGDKPKPSGGGQPAGGGKGAPKPAGPPPSPRPAGGSGTGPVGWPPSSSAPGSDVHLDPKYGPLARPGDYEREQLRKDRERAWRKLHEAEGLPPYRPPPSGEIPGTVEFKPPPPPPPPPKTRWQQLLPDVAHDEQALQNIIADAGLWDALGLDRTVAHARNSLQRLHEDVALFEKVRKVYGDARALSWWWRMRQTQWRQLQATFFNWMFNLCGAVSAMSATHGTGDDWAHTGQPPTPKGMPPRSLWVQGAGPAGLAARYIGHAADFLLRLFDLMEKKRKEEEASNVDTREPEEIVVDELDRLGAFDRDLGDEPDTAEDDGQHSDASSSDDETPEEAALSDAWAELTSESEPVPQTYSPPTLDEIGTVDEVMPDEPPRETPPANAPMVLYSSTPRFGEPHVPPPRSTPHVDPSTPRARPVPGEPEVVVPRPRSASAPETPAARPSKSTPPRAKIFEGEPTTRGVRAGPDDEVVESVPRPRPEPRKSIGRIGRDTRLVDLVIEDPRTPQPVKDFLNWQKAGMDFWGRIADDPARSTQARAYARERLEKLNFRLPKAGDRLPDGRYFTEDYVLGHEEHTRDPFTGRITKEGAPAREGYSYEKSRPVTKGMNWMEERMRLRLEKREKQYIKMLNKRAMRQLLQGRKADARRTIEQLLQHNIRPEKLPPPLRTLMGR